MSASRLRAGDLPADGAPIRVVVNGKVFEVARLPLRGNRWTYLARMLPVIGGTGGWWQRYNWALLKADLQLMAKE